MKNYIFIITLFLLIGINGLTSCQKKKNETEAKQVTTPTTTPPETGQEATDNYKIMTEIDASLSDINTVISDYSLLNGKLIQNNSNNSTLGSICGMTVDTNGLYTGIVRLDYTGAICGNRKRSGSIRLEIINHGMGVRWKNVNAMIKIDYLNYKVETVSNSHNTILYGTTFATNVSGGTWFDLIFLGQPLLTHSFTASPITVQLNSARIFTLNVSRQTDYTWSSASSIISSSITGLANFGGYTNLESYGGFTGGDSIFCKTNSPLVWNTMCGAWSPVSGSTSVKVKSKSYNLNFVAGVDVNGIPVVPTTTSCPYGYRINWTIGSTSSGKTVGYL